ncbi:hypothetical protein B0T26DRAFT_675247 [Lasiosphaeria miniovina]|uniref:Uncharacterized protein n=1 Tax=Lasiosphaeria miniovina TaxID=1954250 RepID=A0AA40AJ56_9PEZI|nr:uncharacterized protein B0T26DRAFT_675247 [Lasiosphaeria miniovina]KAK0716831.1 hypothetical protein B0T26DRAFT_675247 [Lasiosphaeria miniovina]
MAAPQIGDLIKFAELGWQVYNYGWSDELKASRQYLEFGRDVQHLAESLESLSHIINAAKGSFHSHGLPPPDEPPWDETTLLEIIGDYNATLNECARLINENRTYARATAGPIANVVWNIMVQPNVEKLRSRIVLHNTKIQHILKPFEMDLRLRIHSDLARRIQKVDAAVQGVHDEVRRMCADLHTLMRAFDPQLLPDAQPTTEPELHGVPIPDKARQALEQVYANSEPSGFDEPGLRDLADAFMRSFDASTRRFQPEQDWNIPPEEQYWALLTSQFLMDKIIESGEFRGEAAVDTSHWPRYIQSLQQKLSAESRRFRQHMAAPVLTTPAPPIWICEELPAYIESAKLPVAMELLLEMPLETSTQRRWRKLRLLRYCDGTDRRFRLVITAGDRDRDRGEKPPSETRPIEFNIATAFLIPRYASIYGGEPLELILKVRDEMHPLVFSSPYDLYRFQQALTGYEVVDQYTAYRLQVIFVLSSNQKVKEFAALQLWRPMRLEGERVTNDGATDSIPLSGVNDSSRLSIASAETIRPLHPSLTQMSSSPRSQARNSTASVAGASFAQNFQTAGSRASAWSATTAASTTARSWMWQQNDNAAANPAAANPAAAKPVRTGSMLSSFSTASYTTKPVSVVAGANVATTGTLHCKPTEPRLVLFTQNCETKVHGFVSVAIDQKTAANYKACECTSDLNCKKAFLERGTGGTSQPLTVLRLGGCPKANGIPAPWNLLPLAEPLRAFAGTAARNSNPNSKAWRKVIRISMCFEQVNLRKEFSGWPCTCAPAATEGRLMDCLGQWHRGRLGFVKEVSRRERVEWYNLRYQNSVHVEDRRQLPGARQG